MAVSTRQANDEKTIQERIKRIKARSANYMAPSTLTRGGTIEKKIDASREAMVNKATVDKEAVGKAYDNFQLKMSQRVNNCAYAGEFKADNLNPSANEIADLTKALTDNGVPADDVKAEGEKLQKLVDKPEVANQVKKEVKEVLGREDANSLGFEFKKKRQAMEDKEARRYAVANFAQRYRFGDPDLEKYNPRGEFMLVEPGPEDFGKELKELEAKEAKEREEKEGGIAHFSIGSDFTDSPAKRRVFDKMRDRFNQEGSTAWQIPGSDYLIRVKNRKVSMHLSPQKRESYLSYPLKNPLFWLFAPITIPFTILTGANFWNKSDALSTDRPEEFINGVREMASAIIELDLSSSREMDVTFAKEVKGHSALRDRAKQIALYVEAAEREFRGSKTKKQYDAGERDPNARGFAIYLDGYGYEALDSLDQASKDKLILRIEALKAKVKEEEAKDEALIKKEDEKRESLATNLNAQDAKITALATELSNPYEVKPPPGAILAAVGDIIPQIEKDVIADAKGNGGLKRFVDSLRKTHELIEQQRTTIAGMSKKDPTDPRLMQQLDKLDALQTKAAALEQSFGTRCDQIQQKLAEQKGDPGYAAARGNEIEAAITKARTEFTAEMAKITASKPKIADSRKTLENQIAAKEAEAKKEAEARKKPGK